ncbi:Uncharacterized protein M6B38_212185 [Iris pallida]|uniref:Uncharacterized protein n=1 Tax=Iris pallida TaxID=29817 RepID=A0AAX6E357_IRIPA|nr:Uncharacterized protein M6B38_212185 [Iris pallida]
MRRPSMKKTKASTTSAAASPSKCSTGAKRVKAPAAPKETMYFEEKRSLEDLWQAAFPVGTEWDNMDRLREFNWNFTNLESAFEEGGELHGKKVYMFGSTEPQLLEVNGKLKVTLIPIVVVVVSPIPPSDKISITSVQRAAEEIIPMKAMKMAWIPYIPLEDRDKEVVRLKTQIYTMGCTQRRSALKHLKNERVKQYDYCLPYFQPLNPETRAAFENMRFYKFYPVQTPDTPDISKWKVAYINRYYGKAHVVV